MQRIKAYGIALLFSFCTCSQVLADENMSCPDTPNCVSSLDTSRDHFIEPFSFKDTPFEAMSRLKAGLLNEKRVTIVEEQPTHLRAEVRSLIFRFVDDVEFTIIPEENMVHLRSASRTGYSDLGVNRRRMERIRKIFQK